LHKPDQTFVAAAIFVTIFAVSYCLTFLLDMPLPRYYPLQHDWMFSDQPGVPSQGWYGKVIFALLTSGAAASLGYRLPIGRKLAARRIKAIGLGACLISITALVYIVIFELRYWSVI
jgi:hypothetical protein